MPTMTTPSLIDRASSLTERLASQAAPLTPEQLQRWRSNAASGNEGKFSQRLDWTASSGQPPYWWAPALMELLDSTRNRAAGFAPLLDFAFGRLRATVSPVVRPALETALHRALAVVAEQALAVDAALFELGGWTAIFEKYPVLAKLMAIRIQFWVEETDEFFARLHRDLPRLNSAFGPLGELTALSAHHSDPHHRARTVKIATFASGVRLVYKPKDLAIDEAWGRLVAWFNAQQKDLTLRAPRVLTGNGYGWVEFVNAATCETQTEVERYYRNAGALVCLLYILGATDFHYENLIAAGDCPVPVDMETLLTHEFKLPNGASYTQLANRTVLRSGVLPGWEIASPNAEATDISGLGGFDGSGQPTPNVVTLLRRRVDPQRYLAHLVDGFETAYGAVAAARRQLLAPGGALDAFRNRTIRLLFRPTEIYSKLMKRTLHPAFLADGASHSIEFEMLARYLLNSPAGHCDPRMFFAELDALEQLDYPLFEAKTSETTIYSNRQLTGENMLLAASFDNLVATVEAMSPADLERQVAIIRATFQAKAESPSAGQVFHRAGIPSAPRKPSAGELIEHALRIGRELQRNAIPEGNRSVNWLALEPVPKSDRYRLAPLSTSLYGGLPGTALFLAALYKVTGEARWAHLAAAALQSVRDRLTDNVDPDQARTYATEGGIGGAQGLGSIVFGFTRAAGFLNEPAYLQDARKVAHLLTPRLIESDKTLDAMGGAAGAILSLLPLWESAGDERVLELARLCGHHLVSRQLPSGGWPAFMENRPPLTGLSHGAAGIAYALLRLHRAAPDAAFREAALAGLRYEDSLLAPHLHAWPDLRYDAANPLRFNRTGSWCNGTPGIGLARLATAAIHSSPEIERDIQHAVEHALHRPAPAIDTLCCGTFGNLDLLVMAAHHLHRPELLTTARRRAAPLAQEAREQNGYLLFGSSARSFHPGFFRGTAGIGYQLLRLAAPDALPSILVWN